MLVTNDIVSRIPVHALRLFYYRRIMKFEIAKTARIFRGCRFDAPKGLSIGGNTVINRGCRIDTRGGVRIGANVSISENVTLLTAQHDPYDPKFGTTKSSITIEDYAFLGTGVMMLPGNSIGRGGVVGAGSVLTKSVAGREIWVGNPAAKVRERTTEFDYETSYIRHFH